MAILIRKNIHFTHSDVLADVNGRYVIVSGTLHQKPVILVPMYAPKWDDHNFMKGLLSSLPKLDSHLLIVGGDMNCVINPILDRSNSRAAAPSNVSSPYGFYGSIWIY